MNDSERARAIRMLTQMYRPGDYSAAQIAMPKFNQDPEGIEFDEFFDFLQALYLFQSEYPTMEEEDVQKAALSLENLANKYDYPTNQIEVFK